MLALAHSGGAYSQSVQPVTGFGDFDTEVQKVREALHLRCDAEKGKWRVRATACRAADGSYLYLESKDKFRIVISAETASFLRDAARLYGFTDAPMYSLYQRKQKVALSKYFELRYFLGGYVLTEGGTGEEVAPAIDDGTETLVGSAGNDSLLSWEDQLEDAFVNCLPASREQCVAANAFRLLYWESIPAYQVCPEMIDELREVLRRIERSKQVMSSLAALSNLIGPPPKTAGELITTLVWYHGAKFVDTFSNTRTYPLLEELGIKASKWRMTNILATCRRW